MGRPLADDDPLDGSSAAEARFAGPPVDSHPLGGEPRLAVRIDVIPIRRSPAGQPLPERGPDAPVQAPNLGFGQGVRPAERMEASPPQRLVGVDVADPGDEGLVEEQGLQACAAAPQALSEAPGGGA